MQVDCHEVGFSKKIENVPRKLSYEGPSRAMRGCRCRQGIGFSSEIETLHLPPASFNLDRRQGIGFSSEIETREVVILAPHEKLSPGDWLLVRD